MSLLPENAAPAHSRKRKSRWPGGSEISRVTVRIGPTARHYLMEETLMSLNMTQIGNHEVQLWDRSHVRLSRFWEQEPLVLVFLRHYG